MEQDPILGGGDLRLRSLRGVEGVDLSMTALGMVESRDALALVGLGGIVDVRQRLDGVRHSFE